MHRFMSSVLQNMFAARSPPRGSCTTARLNIMTGSLQPARYRAEGRIYLGAKSDSFYLACRAWALQVHRIARYHNWSSPPTPTTASKNMPAAVEIRLFYLLASIAGLSLALLAYQRTVEPLYGSAATDYYLTQVLYAVTTVIYFGPSPSPATTHLILGVLLCAAPTTAYWTSALTARYGNPIWGPAVTHVLVLAPIYYLGSCLHMMVSSHGPLFRYTHRYLTGTSGTKQSDRIRADCRYTTILLDTCDRCTRIPVHTPHTYDFPNGTPGQTPLPSYCGPR